MANVVLCRRCRQLSAFCAKVVLLFYLAGCASSPVTRKEEENTERRPAIIQDVNEFLYIQKIKKEKEREDDRKVGVDALRRRGTGRSPRAEDVPPAVNRDRFLLEVVSLLGVRYSYGGSSKEGMDCSGFTCTVYRAGANTELPRSTVEQFRIGSVVSREELRFGDLVFFNTTGDSPSHVGIYIEDDIFAHASVVEGVTLSSLESTYYKKRFVGARRVLD